MDERFTNRAKKVMQLANKEAQRLNHEYIGTEHILLGLIAENCGLATYVLENLDVDLREVCIEVEKLVPSGPYQPTSWRRAQSPRAKRVIEYSMEEARNLNHNYVGTEHILLGLLREQEGVAAQVLMNLGLKLEVVREEVLNLLGCDGKVEEAMQTKPLHEIEDDLDHAENIPKHVGDSVSADAPPDEPLVSPLDCLADAIEQVTVFRTDAVAIRHVNKMLSLTQRHFIAREKMIKVQADIIILLEERLARSKRRGPQFVNCVSCDNRTPQARAMAAVLDATERAMETKVPIDADAS